MLFWMYTDNFTGIALLGNTLGPCLLPVCWYHSRKLQQEINWDTFWMFTFKTINWTSTMYVRLKHMVLMQFILYYITLSLFLTIKLKKESEMLYTQPLFTSPVLNTYCSLVITISLINLTLHSCLFFTVDVWAEGCGHPEMGEGLAG